MPLPKFNDIGTCMKSSIMKSEFPDTKQRLAVCFSQIKKKGEDMEDENIITIPVDTKVAVDVDVKVITISDRLGIGALYSLNRKKVIEFYFDKRKDWDEDKAIEWYNEHKTIEPEPEEQAKKFFKVDNEKKEVMGPVLVPWEVDLQGDILTEESVEEAAHNFMEGVQDIGEMHRVTGVGTLLESYIAPADFEVNKTKIKKGTWILVTRANKDVWARIKEGTLVGYSIGYSGEREEIEV